MHTTSYLAVIHPDSRTQTFTGTGPTIGDARRSCEQQLRETLNQLRDSGTPVILVAFRCLDAREPAPIHLIPKKLRKATPWQPRDRTPRWTTTLIRTLRELLVG